MTYTTPLCKGNKVLKRSVIDTAGRRSEDSFTVLGRRSKSVSGGKAGEAQGADCGFGRDQAIAREPEVYGCCSDVSNQSPGAIHIKVVTDGTDTDDFNDDRPGLLAARESGIISPLADAGLSKADIRRESRNMGLSTADKPSMDCLATRARVVEIAKAAGFLYIAFDLEGYRMSSMNEAKAGHEKGKGEKACCPNRRRAFGEMLRKLSMTVS